ncbi:MAG: DUF5916 domain-containing protein [Pseudomonadota bacterium]|nr:DUF5916 domain-containing protein [Pseudomonadota bacterium]
MTVFFSRGLWACVLFLISLSFTYRVHAAPELNAQALLKAPQVDGDVLNDEAWLGAEAATGFVQVRPFEGRSASQRTEVFVGYTEDTLYIGVMCYDEDPSGLIISDSRRDSRLSSVDSFKVIIDSFLDRQNGFIFGTTPGAVEYDGQVVKEGSSRFGSGGGGFNKNWDAAWVVQAQVNKQGWSAEFAIPFKSLRYGAKDVQDWGINFERNIARTDETVYWAPLSRQHNLFRVSEAGTLRGVQTPKQRNLKMTPYMLGLTRRGGSLVESGDNDMDWGLDAKYLITPSLSLDLTYNTDFAQVEVDELQVNLDRFSIFLPEKRPFFLENAGQFSVGSPREVELFFSRRIGIGDNGVQQPIDGGVRLSGKVAGSTNVGLLHMQTQAINELASDAFSVARVSQELANRSSIGAIFVRRQGEEDADYNNTYAIDGRWGIGDELTISAYLAQTETPGRRGDDQAGRIRINNTTESWSTSGGYTKVGKNFNPEVGFLSRTNYEKVDFSIFHRRRPENLWGLFELRPHMYHRSFFDNEGFYVSGFTHVDNHWEWRNGIEIHTGVNFIHEGVQRPFEINEGTFVSPGNYDHAESQLVFMSDRRKPLYVSLTSKIGGFYGGDRNALETKVNYRLGDAFTAALTWSHNDIGLTSFAGDGLTPASVGDFKVNVARLRMSYSFTPKILLQALVQYDDRSDLIATNLRFSWLQAANAGLFLVYNEVDDDSIVGAMNKRREVAIKYSRILDVLQ